MIKKLILIVALVTLTTVAMPASTSYAYDLFSGVDCALGDPDKESAVCNRSSEDPVTGVDGAIIRIANIIAYATGAAAIILILIAAIRFMSSGGDPAKVKRARDTVVYSLVGVVIVLFARTIIVYVINRLN